MTELERLESELEKSEMLLHKIIYRIDELALELQDLSREKVLMMMTIYTLKWNIKKEKYINEKHETNI